MALLCPIPATGEAFETAHARLDARDFANLEEAIAQARIWRGSLMPEDFPYFDAYIDAMMVSLSKVRKFWEAHR